MSKFNLEKFLKSRNYIESELQNIRTHNWFDEDESKETLETILCLQCNLLFNNILYYNIYLKLTCNEVLIKKLLE